MEPGRSLTHEAGSVNLRADEDGESFGLSIYDETGGWGTIRGLKRGRNYGSFRVECFGPFGQSDRSDFEKDPHPHWLGEVHSALICVEIR